MTDPVRWREEMRKKQYKHLVMSQVFLRERLQALGPDLAAAHFLCHRNCKVRFRGQDTWTELEADGTLNIPAAYVPGWHIEANTADVLHPREGKWKLLIRFHKPPDLSVVELFQYPTFLLLLFLAGLQSLDHCSL